MSEPGSLDPRDAPVILHQAGESGIREWQLTVWYFRKGGEPFIYTEYGDNQDDPGRPPGYREETSEPLADYIAMQGENHPAIVTYRRLVAEGVIAPN